MVNRLDAQNAQTNRKEEGWGPDTPEEVQVPPERERMCDIKKAEAPPLLTVQQAAEYCGVSYHAMRQFLYQGTVRAIKSGNRFFVIRTALDELLGLNRPEQQEQQEQQN